MTKKKTRIIKLVQNIYSIFPQFFHFYLPGTVTTVPPVTGPDVGVAKCIKICAYKEVPLLLIPFESIESPTGRRSVA